MYPSKGDGLFGVFVKLTQKQLEELGVNFSLIVIKGKRKIYFSKFLTYFKYYIKSFLGLYFKEDDIIFIHFLTHNIPIIWLYNKFQDKPVIVNLHGSDINKVKKHSIVDKIQEKILNKSFQIIVPSKYFKDIILERYLIKTPIFVYPSGGININVFKPKEFQKNETFVISFVSRIDKGKGWETFLSLVEKMNLHGIHTQAIIAGDGREKQELLLAIKESKYSSLINYVGFQEKEELARIYQQSDAFIFATKLSESLGLVGLEAMACGSVVFARNIGAPAYYIRDSENGFLFSDDLDLFLKIKDYYNISEEKKYEIRKNALNTAVKYDSKEVSLRLYDNFKSLHAQN